MKPNIKDLRERFSEVLELYNRAIREDKLEEAYNYMLRLCQSTGFKHNALNNNLFNVLSLLKRYEEAYTYAKRICENAIDQENISQVLYNYQTLMFFKKKLSDKSYDTFQNKVKKYLYEKAQHIKKIHNLFPQNGNRPDKKINIGHLIGLISPGHAPTKMILNELRNINHNQFGMHIFTTEWAANWFFSAHIPDDLQSHYEDLNNMIKTDLKTKLFINEIKDDFLTRSIQICKSIIENKIDILVVNATDSEAITLMVALIKPVPVMLNAVHGGAMFINNFDGIIQLQKDDFIKDTEIPQYYISITSDIQFEDSRQQDVKARRALEKLKSLKEKYIFTGTFGSLFKVDNEQYISTIGSFLQKHDAVFHVFVGWGDFDTLRTKFEKYNVGDRIIYVGFQKNIKPFMEIVDVYLASFPYPGHTCELECMALGKPVVSMAWQEGHHYNSGARVVGLTECIAPPNNYERYKQIAHNFINNKILRHKIGKELQERFNNEFSPLIRTSKVEELYKNMMADISALKEYSCRNEQ